MTENYLASNVGVTVNRQASAQTGAKRYIFVDLEHMPKVYPPIGGVLQNPFKNGGKAFQGDIVQYETSGKITLLKVFKLAKAVAATDTSVLLVRDGFSHIPSAGDVLMAAPTTLAGTGIAIAIGAVTATTATIDGKTVDVWSFDITAADFSSSTLAAGSYLVEAESAGTGKKMLVQNPNAFIENDITYNYSPATGDTDFDGARYTFTPILHAVLWASRASIPPAVLAVNKSRVTGWFEL